MPDSSDADRLRHEMLEEELEAARRKRDSYQALLKDLPEVFEGKFRERIRPVQQRNDHLREEGMALREQIRRALPPAGVPRSPMLPPAAETAAPAQGGMDPEEVLEASEKPEKPQKLEKLEKPQKPQKPQKPAEAAEAAEAAGLRRLTEGLRSTGVTGALALAAGLTLGLGGLLLATHPWRSGEGSQPSAPTRTTDSAQVPRSKADPAPPNVAIPAELPSINLRTTGPSWLEVRSSEGVLLFSGELNGTRSFPLRSGLMIRSGRADLVQLRVNGQPERQLGPIELLDWTTFSPDTPAGAEPDRQP